MLRRYNRQRIWAYWSSIELAARGAAGSFALALFRLARLLGVVAAFFAAANAAMGPQAFENHFGGGRGGTSVLAILEAELAHVVHEALNFRKLVMALAGGCPVRHLPFSASFQPF